MQKITWPGNFRRGPIILALIGIALFYFSFLPVNYSFDGTVFSHFLRYALAKHNWLQVTQIHHLLYSPANYLVYRCLEALCHYRVLEFFHLQLFSLFFAVLSLALIERMLNKLNLTLLLRLFGVAIVAFSYAFWLYAVDAEPHMAGVFFVLAGINLLVFRESSTAAAIGAAFCFSLAAGFHLTNILITVTGFFVLHKKRAPWRRHAQFFLAYSLFMLVIYSVYAAIAHKPVLRFFTNMLFGSDMYSGYSNQYFKPLTLPTLVASLTSLKRALASGTGIGSWLICAAFLVLLGKALKQTEATAAKAFAYAMGLWFAPFFLFFTFWDPANIEFKIQAIIPLLLIATTTLAHWRQTVAKSIGAALIVFLLLSNLFTGIMPLSGSKNNINHQVALAIQRATPANAQILLTGNFYGYGYGKIYIPYFALREVIILDWLLGKGNSLAGIYARLAKSTAAGRPVYALNEIAEMGKPTIKLLEFHHIQASEYSRFNSGIRFILAAKLPGPYRLYRLEFANPKND